MNAPEWTFEQQAEGEAHCHRVVRHLHTVRSSYQTIEVVETASYGIGLFIDGRIQHVASDEHIYSEALAHPPALLLGDRCRRVLVVGGGPGGIVREILRLRAVELVCQVEIDPEMVATSQRYFTHISQGCWDDPRVRLVIADIRDVVATSTESFDLIIYDISEPLVGTPAHDLFSARFLVRMARLLRPGGIFVTWGGSVGPCSAELARGIVLRSGMVFDHVTPYTCHTQSYGTLWLNVLASQTRYTPDRLTAAEVDRRLQHGVGGVLRYYDGETHVHMFALPKSVREAIAPRSGVDVTQPLTLGVGRRNGGSSAC